MKTASAGKLSGSTYLKFTGTPGAHFHMKHRFQTSNDAIREQARLALATQTKSRSTQPQGRNATLSPITLTLDPQTERRIQHQFDCGDYAGPGEVIQRALDLLEADRTWSVAERAELNQPLAESEAKFARGEGIPGDQVREKLAQLRSTH